MDKQAAAIPLFLSTSLSVFCRLSLSFSSKLRGTFHTWLPCRMCTVPSIDTLSTLSSLLHHVDYCGRVGRKHCTEILLQTFPPPFHLPTVFELGNHFVSQCPLTQGSDRLWLTASAIGIMACSYLYSSTMFSSGKLVSPIQRINSGDILTVKHSPQRGASQPSYFCNLTHSQILRHRNGAA